MIETLTLKFEENLEHNFNGEFEVEHEYVGGFEVDWSWLVMSDKVANPPPWLPIAHRNNCNDEDGEQDEKVDILS